MKFAILNLKNWKTRDLNIKKKPGVWVCIRGEKLKSADDTLVYYNGRNEMTMKKRKQGLIDKNGHSLRREGSWFIVC